LIYNFHVRVLSLIHVFHTNLYIFDVVLPVLDLPIGSMG
jgi:hypothetical protein